MSDIPYNLERIADASRRADGSDIPLGAQCREAAAALRAAAAEIERLMKALSDERSAVAMWMIAKSYATGHGDTVADMLNELETQMRERFIKDLNNALDIGLAAIKESGKNE